MTEIEIEKMIADLEELKNLCYHLQQPYRYEAYRLIRVMSDVLEVRWEARRSQ